MAVEFKIRRAMLSDLFQLIDLENSAFKNTPGGPTGIRYALRDGVCLVAALPSQYLVGYTYSRGSHGGPETTIGMLVTNPRFRGNGVGRALTEQLLESAREEGVVKAHVDLRSDDKARKIYEDLGFAIEDTSYNDRVSAGLHMVKYLGARYSASLQ